MNMKFLGDIMLKETLYYIIILSKNRTPNNQITYFNFMVMIFSKNISPIILLMNLMKEFGYLLMLHLIEMKKE